MAEEKDNARARGWSGIITHILSFIPKDMREMIGVVIGLWLFVLMPFVLVASVKFITDAMKAPKSPDKPCWQLQQVGDRIFKLNACTGETVEVKPETKVLSPQPNTNR